MTSLARTVEALRPGDKVRVTFRHLPEPVVGTVRESVSPRLRETRALFLGEHSRLVRNSLGSIAFDVQAVELFDDNARFDRLMEDAQDYLRLYEEARDCPKSEQGWRDKAVAEAKEAFITEWLRGAP